MALKVEAVYLTEYDIYDDVAADLPRFIDDVYNETPRYSALGDLSPIQFEERTPPALSKPPPDLVQRQGALNCSGTLL
jgi:putative transposase